MTNDPAKRPSARALEEMLIGVQLDPVAVCPNCGPVGDEGPPTVLIRRPGPIASFFRNLFSR